jgi:transcriptional regulator with XRE-family HTH domain
MDENTAELSAAIGARVREQRHMRGWTLDHLADVSGVSRRMLVSVEQGTANPSLVNLLRLSDALGIALPVLVEPPRSGPISINRAGEAPVLWGEAGSSEARMVAGLALPDAFELWLWILAPGSSRDSSPHSPGSRELLHVHRGTLVLTLGTETVELRDGDAVAFAGDVEHSYRNEGDQTVHFSAAMFEPAVTR